MPTLANRSSLLAALILGISALSSIPVRSETAPEFARGDLVQLRSGGPLMTVLVMKGGLVNCLWTDYDGQPHDVTFPVGVLQKGDVARRDLQTSNLAPHSPD